MFDYKKFNVETEESFINEPHLRRGQVIFNTMYRMYPDIALKYSGTNKDPFYLDANIPFFVVACVHDVNSFEEEK